VQSQGVEDLPSFEELVRPYVVPDGRGGRDRLLTRLRAKEITTFSTMADNASLVAPVKVEDLNELEARLRELLEHLRTDTHSSVDAEAVLLAREIAQQILPLFDLSRRMGHCFVSTTVASSFAGKMIGYQLRWTAHGDAKTAHLLLTVMVALLGLCFAPAGAVVGTIGLAASSTKLVQQLQIAAQYPKELPPAS
jgi:hypothetical protein